MRTDVKLTSMVKTSGCAAKLPPEKLHRVIDNLPLMRSDKLLEGFESADDALVYQVTDDIVSVQTVDFFPPMVDDPFIFGEVAAANALSDVYAMGGEPAVAMNLLCFPSCLELDVMDKILRGGIAKVKEAGAVIAGGHTIADPTPKYGLCVTGYMRKSDVWSNSGARTGDAVVLTKALGVGIVNTAAKGGEASQESIDAAVDSMTRLNKAARDTARRYTVHAATDVTGFSLAGHSQECAAASNVTIEFDINALPVIDGARKLATFGFIPEGRYTNEDYLFDKVRFEAGIPQDLIDIAFDPQTSGGLLLFMPEEDARAFVREMDKPYCRIIGRVIPKTDRDVIFRWA
ncbi:MAG: selenide, water dikinase SelD [Spirochaetales bacterium]|nr:selenide, water dikinase SelD [Spirochaetales bacterium]